MILTTVELALVGAVLVVAAMALLRWPGLGTILATVLLYLNLPAIAASHHVPPVMIIAAAVALVVPALTKHWVVNRDGIIIDRPFLLTLLFLGCTIVSSFFAKSQDAALVWLVRFAAEGIVVYLLFINLIRGKSALRHLIWVLLVCGAFLASLSVYQELSGSYANDFGGLAERKIARDHLLEGFDRGTRHIIRQSHRAHGPSLDANRYAQILIVLLPLAWCLIRDEPKPLRKTAAAVCASLILGGVLLTYSRGAFVGMVVMLLVMGMLRVVTWRQMFIAGAALVLSIAVVSPGYIDRMGTLRGIEGLVDPGSGSAEEPDPVARNRATIMLAAWRLFLDYPVLGAGPGQFAPVYVIDYAGELYSIDRVTARHFRAHSLYLEMAAETGVVGLSAFMAIVIATLGRLAVARRRAMGLDASIANLAAAFFVAIVAYLVTALFLHLAYERYLFLLLAFAGATVQVAESGLVGDSTKTLTHVRLDAQPAQVARADSA